MKVKGQWHAPVDQERPRPNIDHPAAVFRARLCRGMVGVERKNRRSSATKLRPLTCVRSPLLAESLNSRH